MRKKNRWSEVNGGNLCLVDGDGQILARVTKHVLDGTFKYKDLEFIDAYSVMKYVENTKFSETESE
jgi:hypothetical protein